jgi:flagellar motor protein MotB
MIVDEDNPYWMSFSDVMSALLIIFILAAVILIVQLMELEENALNELNRADEVRQEILNEAKEQLELRGIRVTISQNDTVLSIPNDTLGFGTAEYLIGENFTSTALQIGEVLGQVIRDNDRIEYLDTVFVEGHTDIRPLNRAMMNMDNWGLSAYRAISLWQLWESLPQEVSLNSLRNLDDQLLFSVSGYGPSRPVTETQITEEQLRENRRIDIRFTIRRPDRQQIESLFRTIQSGVQ